MDSVKRFVQRGAGMTTLKPVRPEERELLWNINQKYLYEMTNFYDNEMDEQGNIQYGCFDEYFRDPKRKAFFIMHDEQLAGFVFLNPYSRAGGSPDYCMAEFTVFPVFRRKHIAAAAVREIFKRFPGKWEIKYNEKNLPAKALWTGVTAQYSPAVIHLNEMETVLQFTVKV